MNKLIKIDASNVLAYLSILIFIGSLFTNTFYIADSSSPNNIETYGHGWPLLLMGWLDLLAIQYYKFSTFAWFANPALFVSLYFALNHNNLKGLRFGLLSLLLMASFLLRSEIIINENISMTDIVGYDLGYFLWVLSAITICLHHFFLIKKIKISEREKND